MKTSDKQTVLAATTVADPRWAAVQARNELVAIDPMSDSVVARVPVPGIEHPHGFYVDAVRRLL